MKREPLRTEASTESASQNERSNIWIDTSQTDTERGDTQTDVHFPWARVATASSHAPEAYLRTRRNKGMCMQ